MTLLLLGFLAVRYLPRGYVATPLALILATFTLLMVMGHTDAAPLCIVITTAYYLTVGGNNAARTALASLPGKALRLLDKATDPGIADETVTPDSPATRVLPTGRPAVDTDDDTIEMPALTDEVIDAYEIIADYENLGAQPDDPSEINDAYATVKAYEDEYRQWSHLRAAYPQPADVF